MRKVGYIRVAEGENNDDAQRASLASFGCKEFYIDSRRSAASTTRPALKSALHSLQPGDWFVVCKLDKIGCSLGYIVSLIAGLRNKGVRFAATEELRYDWPVGFIVEDIITALARADALIAAKEGKRSRGRGAKRGRPFAAKSDQIKVAREIIVGGGRWKDAAEATGISSSTLRRHLGQKRKVIDEEMPF